MLRKGRQRQRVVIALLSALALVSGGASAAGGWLDGTLQRFVYDAVITNSPAPINDQVVIVALDDSTIAAYGRWPLPRRAYAELLDRIAPASPSVIAFDVGLYDPSDRPEDDRALANAIRRAGNVILAVQGQGEGRYANGAELFGRLQLPLPMFREGALALGSVNIDPDDDGKVRSAQLVVEGPDPPNTVRLYALPLVAAAKHVRADLGRALVDGDHLVVPANIAPRVIPIDASGAMPVYYAAPPSAPLGQFDRPTTCARPASFCVLSLADVTSGAVDPRILTGKAVFVGAHSASGLADDYAVPNGGGVKMYGVEIWANAALSIFTNRFAVIRQSFPVTLATYALLAVAGILLVFRLRVVGFLLSLALLAIVSLAEWTLYQASAGLRIGSGIAEVPSIGYLVPSIAWWVAVLGYLLIEEQVALTRTQSTFGRFVTPSVARTIMDREETGRLALGGEEKRVTVLFGDIRGFTTLSEGMDPAQLLNTLNRYFDGMVTIVERYEGTVNKYNGDNIMVIWGAPLEVHDQARKAVACALELQRFIQAERAKGGPDVSFGFGINTGSVVAGFLGARGRMEYTVIGDTANVASRLTSSDIARRDQVAVSATTLAELGGDAAYIPLGAIAVKGRAEPVQCFQIDRLGPLANPNPAPPPERPIAAAAVAGFH